MAAAGGVFLFTYWRAGEIGNEEARKSQMIASVPQLKKADGSNFEFGVERVSGTYFNIFEVSGVITKSPYLEKDTYKLGLSLPQGSLVNGRVLTERAEMELILGVPEGLRYGALILENNMLPNPQEWEITDSGTLFPLLKEGKQIVVDLAYGIEIEGEKVRASEKCDNRCQALYHLAEEYGPNTVSFFNSTMKSVGKDLGVVSQVIVNRN